MNCIHAAATPCRTRALQWDLELPIRLRIMASRSAHMEEVRYTRVAMNPPFDVIRARFVQQKFVQHAHHEYAIGVVEEGCGRIEIDKGIQEQTPGAIIAIPPGMAHAGCAADERGWGYRMMYLPSSYLERAAERAGFPAGARPWFAGVALGDDELADRITEIHTALELAHDSPAALDKPLDDVLHDLARRHGEIWDDDSAVAAAPTREIRRLRAFLDEAFTRRLTIDEMSGVAQLSPYYLIRAFRRAFGLPPYTYVEQLRVQRARQLIEHGSTIVDAALRSGFADQSHLTRRFKATLGITPGVIARRAR